ncbi:uncharacterized protein [Argopecten irradians]|uniref:uncharacterized protein n=1 Tax=Argopecten irradians TaxID=31199 RepID=UPI003714D94F
MLQVLIFVCFVVLRVTVASRHHHFNILGHDVPYPATIEYNTDLDTIDLSVYRPGTDPRELFLHYITDRKNDMFIRNAGMPGGCEVGKLPLDILTLLESWEKDASVHHEIDDSLRHKASLRFIPSATNTTTSLDKAILQRYCHTQDVQVGTFQVTWLDQSP